MTLPAFLCLLMHRAYIRQRFLAPGIVLLHCDRCEAFR